MMPVVILLCGFIFFRKRCYVCLQLSLISFLNPIKLQRVGQPPSAQGALPTFPAGVNIGAAPRRFAAGVQPDMSIGLPHHAH